MADYASILASSGMWSSSIDSMGQQASVSNAWGHTIDSVGEILAAGGGGGPTITLYFKMRAQDSGASPPGYVTWVVQNAPDFAGAGYSGGTPTPVGAMVLGSAVVAAQWEETA